MSSSRLATAGVSVSRSENCQQTLGCLPPGKLGLDSQACSGTHALAQFRGSTHVSHSTCACCDVTKGEKMAATAFVADHFGHPAVVAGHHRQATGHRFRDRNSECLFAQPRKQTDIGTGIKRRQFCVRDRRMKDNPFVNAKICTPGAGAVARRHHCRQSATLPASPTGLAQPMPEPPDEGLSAQSAGRQK